MESYSILRPLNFDSHVLKSKSSKFHIFSELLPTQAIICNLLLCVIFYESNFWCVISKPLVWNVYDFHFMNFPASRWNDGSDDSQVNYK